MDYKKGYVFELMAQGRPTDNREPYFKDAVDETEGIKIWMKKQKFQNFIKTTGTIW